MKSRAPIRGGSIEDKPAGSAFGQNPPLNSQKALPREIGPMLGSHVVTMMQTTEPEG
jgi:hypothetical protein